MNTYAYDVPVMMFDTCIDHRWKAETKAVSEKKAKSNFTYQYKMLLGKTANSKIELPGKIRLLD